MKLMTDEYIRREDASNWLKQYGQDVLHGKYKFSLMYIWKNIMDLPSADVAPVVRCRDCEYYGSRRWCELHSNVFDDNAFCSYGKRREE